MPAAQSMKHLLCIGNSHLLSVLDAALRLSGRDSRAMPPDAMWRSADLHVYDAAWSEPVPVRARFVLAGGFAPPIVRVDPPLLLSVRRRYLDALDTAVAALDGRVDRVVSCFLGNEHSIFSLAEHPVPFDVLVDADDAGVAAHDPPRQVVPVDVVRRELADRARPTALSCEILRSRFPEHDVVHVMPPPPIGADEHIRERPEVFVNLLEEYGLAPAPLRRKVYWLYAEALGAALGAVGVGLLTPPDAAVVDGYLAPGYWSGATHANHRYGRLVLEQLGAA